MTLNSWTMLGLCAGLLLAASLHLLSASGHFPKEVRTPEIGIGIGPILLHGTIVLVLLAVAVGTWLVWQAVPWYALILGGGIAVLIAPLILPCFSDRFVDGRPALIAFAALAYLALGCIWLVG